jgi:hypothetical protein
MRTKDGLALVLALLVAVGLGVLGTSTFSPEPADSDPSGFSAMRAMTDIERIAARPHPTGSPANAQVRSYLEQRLESLGLDVTEQVSELSEHAAAKLAEWSGRSDAPPQVVSIVATLPGRDRTLPAVLLMAHLDTVWGSPGAPDDTTGVAAILETVRALRRDGQPGRDLIVLFTDGEELGLQGAHAFFAANPLRRHVGAVINVEARGGGGRATLFETSRNNGNAVRRYAAAADRPAGSSLSNFIYKILPNRTDLTEARSGPYVAYNIAFIGRPGLYHSPLATPARLDKGTVQDIGDQTLALTRELAGARPLPAPAPDIVFFDLFGLAMAYYPGWAGWLMLAAGAIGMGLAARREPREARSWWRELAAPVRVIGLAVLTAAVLYGLNAISGATGPVNYYDRLAALARLEAVAFAGALASFVVLFAGWRAGPRTGAFAALPLFMVAIALQATAPTAAYVVVVPLMLVGLGQLGTLARNPLVGRITATVAAALVTGYMIQFGHQLVQGVGNDLLPAATLPFVLAAFSWLPLWPGLTRRSALTLTTVLLAVAVAIALWVRLDPVAPSAAVYSTFK